tara:strand:- start:7320 stop:7727 length:408 start_codon:yes stop_codon:yes gene_type:complete
MDKANSVFINGRAQIIEMLQIMPAAEKEKLLKNIRARNPQMAQELMVQSLTFDQVARLGDDDLIALIEAVRPVVWGVALKGQKSEFQRRVLSLAPRGYAEEAYGFLTATLQNEKRDVKRAQSKIIEILIGLSRKN